MIEQRVENRSLKGWRGIALVLALAALVILGSCFFTWLGRYIGGAASVLFIAFGGALAWALLDRCVLAFVYTCNGSCLRVCRAYGKRQRFMLDVWLNSVRACGAPEEMRARFPGARVQRAVRPACPIPPLAVVWQDGGKPSILVLQPGDRLRDVLIRAAKNG